MKYLRNNKESNRRKRKTPIERIRKLNTPMELNLFMYHERLKTVYSTRFQEICEYLEQLDLWEDIDSLIVDKKFDWFVGITHDDILLIYGL